MLVGDEVRQRRNSQTAKHPAQDCIEIVYGKDWLALLPRLGPGLKEPVHIMYRRAGVFAEDDETVLVEILGLLRHAVLFYVFRRRIDMGWHADEVTLNQIRLTRRRHANRHVGFAHRQVELGIVDHECNLDFGVKVEEFPYTRSEP